LGQQGLAQRWGHRCLRAGILAPLAAQHADRIMLLVPAAIVPFMRCSA
jgi:hypothetical protein